MRYLFVSASIIPVLILSSCYEKSNDDNSTQENPGATENDGDENSSSGTSSNIETVAEELIIPWAVEKHEDEFFITEREGNIARVQNNGSVSRE
ncbi:hypothetical protein [Alteribacillus sp. HJP-4]|uniref:hypothetical protein n=1 Tax=Alteribacillus sp. HJP-4 TaxID=2775394 RepID=UPI0035CCE451